MRRHQISIVRVKIYWLKSHLTAHYLGVFAFIDPQSFISVYSNPAIRQLFHTKLVNDEIQWNNCFIIYSTTMPITRRKMKEKREEKHKYPQFLYLPLAWRKASATP